MNLLEALQYLSENPSAVLRNKKGSELGEILRKRAAHFSIQHLHPEDNKYTGGIPIYVNEDTVSSEWQETGKTFEEIIAYLPEYRKQEHEAYLERMKSWVGPPPL